ncbi:MAG: O-methyltransferase [Wujia sp.]
MAEFERITSYIRSLIHDEAGYLGEIYNEAKADNVPVIRPEAREFMRTQLLLTKPENILEIGTAVGYSALFMSSVVRQAAITTMELDKERIKIAKSNIRKAGKEKQINVLEGDANDLLKTLPDTCYDFIFVDAAKAQYINYLPEIKRVAAKGAVIITDNVLQEGDVLESHFLVEKRNRTIHDRMRDYLYAICNDEELVTSVMAIGDGMSLSIKK